MKIKMTQSIAIIEDKKSVVAGVGQVLEVKDKTAQGIIDAGFAEKIVEEKKTPTKAKAKAKTEEAGE